MNLGGLSPEQAEVVAHRYRVEIARAAAKRKDILTWGWALFPDKFPLPFCKIMHQHFIDIRAEEFTNAKAPRFHAKTTIKCFLIPIFQAVEEPDTFKFYLNVQATDKKALAVNTSIRVEFERNAAFRELYGDRVGRQKWSDQTFVTTDGVIFSAVGAGQSLRGIQFENYRPDYIIVDDLYDEEDINNPESTQAKNNWFWGTLFPALAIGRKTSMHVQGTAINTYDLYTQLEKNPDVKSRPFKAIIDEANRRVLWPEAKSYEALCKMREAMGTLIFNREMQNEMHDDANAIIRRSWIREYDPAVAYRDLSRHFFVEAVYLCVDPSVGAKVENDPTGIALMLKCRYDDGKGNVFFIEDVDERHISLDERVAVLETMCARREKGFQVAKVRIEAIAGFKDFSAEVKRRTNLPVQEIAHVKDKITNLQNKSHFFENGKVFINKNIEPRLKDKLIHQLTTNHPKNDDIRDAVLLGLDSTGGLWKHVG
jgi:hypothetical protein